MKLIGNLKEQVAATTNKAEAKEVIAKAGMELTDEEMDMVSGGCDAIERLKSIDDDSKIRCKETTELNKKTAENMHLLNNAQRH